MKTTESTYSALTKAYKHFNKALFDNKLPDCLFTFQRKNKSYGYFASKRFSLNADGSHVDEIAMNPSKMANRPLKDTLSTLVHEMVHLQQYHFGKPAKGGWHNPCDAAEKYRCRNDWQAPILVPVRDRLSGFVRS